ncbi:TIGR03086 family metal-binding protein [Actinoplanes sp. NPDC051861]|uniref:TIGR03086 family metal-binding protein n=1 Tax=Actinoplanes sp. NPDC051861 TaxID=3155170 RepID=UPI0034256FAC
MIFPVLKTALDSLQHVTAAVGADRLDDPTPCSEWTVVQVLYHAAGDQHAWASVVGAGSLPTYNPFDPPRRLEGGVQETIAKAIEAATGAWSGVDPAASSVRTPLPPVPEMTPALAAAACALDAAVHAWDVAVATGQPSPLTAALAEQLLPAAQATADPLRGFAYASALPAQPSDDAAATLLRHLGRDPHWKPGFTE